MPGHSYKGSSASGNAAAVFPPTPTALYNGEFELFQLAVAIALCTAGRPTFDGYVSNTGVGNPTTNPAGWSASEDAGAGDTGPDYIEGFISPGQFFIGRTRYGLNVSAWSNVAAFP